MPLPFLPGWVVARGYYQVRWRHTHRHCGECGGELQLAYIGSHPWSFSGPDRLPAGLHRHRHRSHPAAGPA